jgi:hypothetical protein
VLTCLPYLNICKFLLIVESKCWNRVYIIIKVVFNEKIKSVLVYFYSLFFYYLYFVDVTPTTFCLILKYGNHLLSYLPQTWLHKDWISCDSCSKWFHRNCAGLSNGFKWRRFSKKNVQYLCDICKWKKTNVLIVWWPFESYCPWNEKL